VLFSKVLASQITAFDTELFALRPGIAKANSMNIECIILITDSLSSVKKIVDFSVYSEQVHSLTVCSVLKSFFSCGLNHKIKF